MQQRPPSVGGLPLPVTHGTRVSNAVKSHQGQGSAEAFSLAGSVRCILIPDNICPDDPRDIVRALLVWNFGLDRKEVLVLEHLTAGHSDMEIAAEMRIGGLNTVKKAVRAVLGKLGVRNRTQAAVLAARCGLGLISNHVPRASE